MKSYIIEDSSFILAVIDSGDAFHNDALFVFKELNSRKDIVQIIIPPLVIYEVIVTLRRKGVRTQTIESKLLKLVNIDNISVLSVSELSAFKHAKHALNSSDQGQSLRTHDFLIFCVASELDGLILTFDKKLRDRCKTVYSDVFYCSPLGDMVDETYAFLKRIDENAGVETMDLSEIPF